MQKLVLLAALLLAALLPISANADMFQDASNAKKPEAQTNLGIVYSTGAGNVSIAPSTYAAQNGLVSNLNNTSLGVKTMPLLTNAPNNTAIGFEALNSLTTGNDNTAVGSFAGLWVKTNIFNTAVGSAALRYSDGYGNVAVGHGAMAGNDPPVAPVLHTGASNTVIGSWSFQVLKGNTNSNTGLGTSSGAWISNGSDNVAIGALAVAGCTVGDSMCGAPGPGDVFASQNVGVGNEALRYTKSNAQVALGMQALLNNTTGQLSTALGHQALKASVADVRNVAIGYNVLAANNGGNDNTAAGTYAMIAATTGSSNAVFGSEAGSKLTTGNNNTVIGPYVASTTLTTGSNNLLLGVSSACDTAAPGDSNIFQVCGTGGPVWSAINTHIPVNSTTTIAGTLKVNAWLASAGGGGLYVCVDSAGVMYRKASCP